MCNQITLLYKTETNIVSNYNSAKRRGRGGEGTGEEEEKKQQVLNEQKYQRPKYWVWAESREHRPGIRVTALLWRQNEDGTGFRVSRSRFVSKRNSLSAV